MLIIWIGLILLPAPVLDLKPIAAFLSYYTTSGSASLSQPGGIFLLLGRFVSSKLDKCF